MIDLLSYFTDEMVTASLLGGQAGSYVSGEWIPSLAAATDIRIVYPQPLTDQELLQLPQGERVRNYVKTWTKSDVEVRSGTTDADRITYGGKTYLVYKVGQRTVSGGFVALTLREITDDE